MLIWMYTYREAEARIAEGQNGQERWSAESHCSLIARE